MVRLDGGRAKDIAPFIDPIFENNILLTMTERLTMNGRPKNTEICKEQERDCNRRIWFRKVPGFM